jgi:hypothetical protein
MTETFVVRILVSMVSVEVAVIAAPLEANSGQIGGWIAVAYVVSDNQRRKQLFALYLSANHAHVVLNEGRPYTGHTMDDFPGRGLYLSASLVTGIRRNTSDRSHEKTTSNAIQA